MEQQDQDRKERINQNMQDLENLAKTLQSDASDSLKGTVSILKKIQKNMDIDTALKMKDEMEAAGTSFEKMNDELGKFKKAAARWAP